MVDNREALLDGKNKYFENCPGCKIEQLKETNSGVPFKHLFYVWVVVLAAALPISSLFPFLYFMIRDFHIANKEEDIGYYAGYVGSAFMFGRALTSILWGMIADRYGRKPVIVFGTFSVVTFNTLFGLSTNFWVAISARFLLGSLCGILGPMRAYASEVCHKEYQALGMSVISTSWGIGLVIGPALGGFLAQPAEKFPHIFAKESLFGRFPYFLPCFLISLFALGVLLISCSLPETLHIHKRYDKESDEVNDELVTSTCEPNANEKVLIEGRHRTSQQNLLKNWPLMSSIIIYCVFQLHDMAYAEGLDSRKKIGNARMCAGLYLLRDERGSWKSACLVSFSSKIKENTIMLWHYRLAHPNFLYLKKLFPDLFNKGFESYQCEICQFSKHTCNSYPSQPYKSTHHFSMIHSDVLGPLRVTWLFLVKDKSKVSSIFQNFNKMVQTQI
ncbi:protein ZINC INDUCED FACILITATOR 1-like isoform X6 [Durio zibethinus]|uniref:Protein ZINC INDUCED FACILITATOR 1-like isoform X6 n=1 Tax=Durio zibethinus TaxID=66656 RepID=A0A6P5XD01_DURZI|nr:protein ZINC INDUCED FACILITATOR 1-like isoform X6 [Durio zibethinus]